MEHVKQRNYGMKIAFSFLEIYKSIFTNMSNNPTLFSPLETWLSQGHESIATILSLTQGYTVLRTTPSSTRHFNQISRVHLSNYINSIITTELNVFKDLISRQKLSNFLY